MTNVNACLVGVRVFPFRNGPEANEAGVLGDVLGRLYEGPVRVVDGVLELVPVHRHVCRHAHRHVYGQLHRTCVKTRVKICV